MSTQFITRIPITIATRGSALALAQSNLIRDQISAAFPELAVEVKIIKTTGDKLQTASLASANLPKGLFTKELETALLDNQADLAVHSLKDLPTDLPSGLILGGVTRRADVRDVLIYRESPGKARLTHIADLPRGATIATSSARRQAQLHTKRPDLKIVPIRGNVPTRVKKLAAQPEIDAIILAVAGLERLHFQFGADGSLTGEGIPSGMLAAKLSTDEMLPCVGQAAIGIEIRENDPRLKEVCANLTDHNTLQCVLAERAFLKGMGGGCQLAVAAYAQVEGNELIIRAMSFLGQQPKRGELRGAIDKPVELGQQLAQQLSR